MIDDDRCGHHHDLAAGGAQPTGELEYREIDVVVVGQLARGNVCPAVDQEARGCRARDPGRPGIDCRNRPGAVGEQYGSIVLE